jgi:kynureninase
MVSEGVPAGWQGGPVATPDRDDALALDRSDPLAGLRAQFVIPDDGLVYLDGNSLGRPTRAGLDALRTATEQEWAGGLIRSWTAGPDAWAGLPATVGDLIGTGLLGARPDEVLVADSTSVNLARLLRAGVRARPGRSVLVTESDTFPTDGYLLEELARECGMTVRTLPADLDCGVAPDALAAGLDTSVALACLSAVSYRSGARLAVTAATAAVHAVGALALWDLSHAAGAVPLDLTGAGVDLAVGCTYKYLNGGPGSPAFLYVRGELLPALDVPLWGWFGRHDRFGMDAGFERATGIGGLVVGTPPVLALRCLQASVGVLVEVGLASLVAKADRLGQFAVGLVEGWLEPLGVRLASPRDPAARGAHLTVSHHRAAELTASLGDRGVVVDFRTPERIRLGLAPATTRYVDVWDALDRLRALLS